MYPPPHSHPYAPVPPPRPLRRWWQHPALIITLLVIFPPAGIALAWTSLWKKSQKIVATVLSGLWFLLPFLTSDPPKDDAKADRPAATASPSPTPTPTPTPTPSETEEAPVMPALVGGDYASAEQVVTDNLGRAYAAYKDVELPAEYGTWLVCFQRPEAGVPVTSMVPVVYLTQPGVPCPKSPNTVLHKPTPKPTPPPAPKPRPTTQPPTTAPEPEPEPTRDTADENVYYANCAAVRAANAAPIHRGDPGYSSRLDRDGDGVGCEN
ncbi:excalibur calcium-binding domain-containing protein [Streptomyces sp. NPDC098101]|uniref:excalibur calcium-binding domain-containing protein n=1 Tax=Streptomyces sp. NPDC098101 TaxID=3366096 RepID=UPI00380C5AFC